MTDMITFELHKQYIDDLEHMGINWIVNDADDRYVDVTVNKWSFGDQLFAWLDDTCTAWY